MKTYINDNMSFQSIVRDIRKIPKYRKKLWRTYAILLCVLLAVLLYFGFYFGDKKDEYSMLFEKATEYEKEVREFDTVGETMGIIVKLITEYDVTKEYAKENVASYNNLNFERICNLATMLKKIQTDFSAYNLDIFVTRMSDGMIVSGSGNTYSFTDNEFDGINLAGAVSTLADNDMDLASSITVNDELSDNLSFVYRKIYDNSSPLYIFISLSYDDMRFLCNKDGNCYIFSNCSEQCSNAVIEYIAQHGKPITLEHLKINNKTSVLFGQMNIADTDIMYAKSFVENTGYKIWFIVPLLIFIILFSVVVGFILSQYSYTPLKKILTKMGIDNNDGIDEVLVAERKIDDIISNNYYMEKAINDKNEKLFNHFIFDILNGFVWGETVLKDSFMHKAEFIFGECGLFVLKFAIDSFDSSEVFELLKKMTSKITMCITAGGFDSYAAVIYKENAAKKAQIISIINNLRTKYKFDVAYAKTNGSDGEIVRDYRALLFGLENKMLTTTKDIINLEDIREISKNRIIYSIQTESELKKYCESGERERALYCLKNIIETNFSEDNEIFVSLKYALSITIKRILSSLNLSEADFFDSRLKLEEEIIRADNYTKLQQIMRDIIEMICEYACENEQNEDIGTKIIDYINNNLYRDISISDVSETLGVSASYISKTLRNNYNTSFKVYIDNERVRIAKKMMDEDKDIMIKDIAQSLGYNNVVSFIRMFKKVEGISPGAYQSMQ